MKKGRSSHGLLVAAALTASTGCATLMNPSTQPVTIVSDRPELDERFAPDLRLRGPAPSEPPASPNNREAAR